MDNAFAILMLIFGAVLLLYGVSLLSGNPKLLPLKVQPSLRKADQKGQTKHIGKITVIVALVPVAGGLIGLFLGNTACLIGMIAAAAVLIGVAVRNKKKKSGDVSASDRRNSDE